MRDSEAASTSSEASEQPSSGSASEDQEEESLNAEKRAAGAEKKKKKKKKVSLNIQILLKVHERLNALSTQQKKKSEGSPATQPAASPEEKAVAERQRVEADTRQAICKQQKVG